MDQNVRYLRYEKGDLVEIKQLYENVMAVASHGLFFRSGRIMGKRMIERSGGEDLRSRLTTALADEGWVENITFDSDRIIVNGSFEVIENKGECTCHMLRGVLASLTEGCETGPCTIKEDECVSKGDEACIFSIRRNVR